MYNEHKCFLCRITNQEDDCAVPCDIILAQIGAKEVDEGRNSSRGEVTLYFPARVVHRCVRIRQRNLKRLNNDLNFVELAKKVCPRLCELSPQSEAESRNLGQTFLANSVSLYLKSLRSSNLPLHPQRGEAILLGALAPGRDRRIRRTTGTDERASPPNEPPSLGTFGPSFIIMDFNYP